MVAVQKMMIVYWAFVQSLMKIFIGGILMVQNAKDALKSNFNAKRSENGEIINATEIYQVSSQTTFSPTC